MEQSGICYLVGAGPGDPGLLTVKGLACLRRAEVVLYDHLTSEEVLAEAPPGAERVYVGKRVGCHAAPQEEINRQLCALVRAGRVVVRLKGGDPFVFGRGGEEALALARAGLAFEVVPGVTAGVAAAAYAGIPVTHRGLATAVTFVTGHEAPGDARTDWAALARGGQTLCVYMGVTHLPAIARALVAGGRAASEPAAVVEWGTWPRQRCVTGTLGDIAERARDEGVVPPALVVIGPVAALGAELAWFRAAAKPPILLVAFGTSVAEAQGALEHLDQRVRAAHPDREVWWAFTSGRILAKLRARGQTTLFARRVPLRSVAEAYEALAAAGHPRAVVQSLHVVPGEEYQKLRATPAPGLVLTHGRPLIQDRAAAAELARVLAPRFGGEDEVTVLCGHGNEQHPEYNELLLALDEHVRREYPTVFVACVEGEPDADRALADARATGLPRVVFLPVMVVAGDHVMNDVMGEHPDSWKSRLGLPARAEPGLGTDDGVVALFLERLAAALGEP